MKYFAAPEFWEHYNRLSPTIQTLADKNFELLKTNPRHPSLRLKKINRFWSVRIGRKHRALGVEPEKGLLWFWIDTHSEYDKMMR